MTGDSLLITARDLQQDAANVSRQFLEIIAAMAVKDQRPVLLKIEFPGEPVGGFIATPRRVSWWLSRLVWRLGTRAMLIGL